MATIFFLKATESNTGLRSGFTTFFSAFLAVVEVEGSDCAFPQPEINKKTLKLNNICTLLDAFIGIDLSVNLAKKMQQAS
jgi:hypothetical protein